MRSLLDILAGLKNSSEFESIVLFTTKGGPLVSQIEEMQIEYRLIEMPEKLLKVSRKNRLLSFYYLLCSIQQIPKYLNAHLMNAQKFIMLLLMLF